MRTENTYAISAADSPPPGRGLVADSGGLKTEEIIVIFSCSTQPDLFRDVNGHGIVSKLHGLGLY